MFSELRIRSIINLHITRCPRFFEQLLDFIKYIEPRSALFIFCNISRLARFEPKKQEH